jgi:hypothetical protein
VIAQMTQAAPPDTATYYHIAYTWAAVLYGSYALSLWRRARRVRERLAAAAVSTVPRRDT